MSSCLPLNCLFCKKTSKNKLRPSTKLPTIQEFLYSNPYAREKAGSTQSFSPRVIDAASLSPKDCSSTQIHRSRIALRHGTAFTPLNMNDSSVNNSGLSNIRQNSQEKNLFITMQSFDTMFGKHRPDKKEEILDPFVLGSGSKLKVIPVTPVGWRRRTVQPKKVDLATQKIFKENKSEN